MWEEGTEEWVIDASLLEVKLDRMGFAVRRHRRLILIIRVLLTSTMRRRGQVGMEVIKSEL